MIVISAKDYGIIPGSDITEEVKKLLTDIRSATEEKTVVFDKGEYYLDSEKCKKHMLYITNTAGEKEFSSKEIPHLNEVPFYFKDLQNLTFDGNDSVFIIDGKVTNMAVIKCRNITIKNMEIRHRRPDMHELKVVEKTKFYVDFQADRETVINMSGGKACFTGKDYEYPVNKPSSAWWIGLIKEETPDKLERTSHPLSGSVKIKLMPSGIIRASFINTGRFDLGDRFYIYQVRRQYVGVFADRSEGITFENFRQRFNYSLAFVAQNCENITIENSEFAPEEDSPRKMASVADFIQICMCRGQVTVKNCLFDGAGDDCMNVHGIHFEIKKINGSRITVNFMHPQTSGFNPLRKGDTIAFIDPETMLEKGRTVIKETELKSDTEIEIKVENSEDAAAGYAVEDISACPDVLFSGNTAARIITRGLLLTTRGKVIVENNRFLSTTMSGILISDDADNWYESGMCLDVTIRNNIFDYCGETPVMIMPENKKHEGPVHRNIRIIDNEFRKYEGKCIFAKSAENIEISGNSFQNPDYLETVDCTGVIAQ